MLHLTICIYQTPSILDYVWYALFAGGGILHASSGYIWTINTSAEKQQISPQTYPAMGLEVGGGAARFPSSPGPTPPGGLLPSGSLNTSDLHLKEKRHK